MRRCAFSTNNKYDRYIITAPSRGPYFYRSTALPPEDPPDGVPYAGAPPAETIRAVRQPAGEGQAGARRAERRRRAPRQAEIRRPARRPARAGEEPSCRKQRSEGSTIVSAKPRSEGLLSQAAIRSGSRTPRPKRKAPRMQKETRRPPCGRRANTAVNDYLRTQRT